MLAAVLATPGICALCVAGYRTAPALRLRFGLHTTGALQALRPRTVLFDERMFTEFDHVRLSRFIRSDCPGAFDPATSLDALLGLMRHQFQRLRRCAYQWRQRRGGTNGNDWSTFRNAELLGLFDRVQRNEVDLRGRLAARVEAMGCAGASISDPCYQRHYFAVESLELQRDEVERELSRRGVFQ
jgi:hypothetical protein